MMKRAIVVMVVVWIAVMATILLSPSVRARYWGWRLMRSSSDDERETYASRLSFFPDASLGVTRRLLTDANPEVRRWAVRIVEHSRGSEVEDLLFARLADTDLRVRDAAAIALGRRQAAGLVDRLSRLAVDSDEGPAAAAVFGLQRMANSAAEEGILKALETAQAVNVCVQAIESLGLLGVERAEPLLKRRLEDRREVQTPPANERAVLSALAAQRGHWNANAPLVTGLSRTVEVSGRTVADYAAEALRRLKREGAPTSRPATTRSGPTSSIGTAPP